MFPIFSNAKDFRNKSQRWTKKLSQQAQVEIERLQPYHETDPFRHPLWAIHVLDVKDKHRLLIVTGAFPKGGEVEFDEPPTGARVMPIDTAAYAAGAVIAEVHWDRWPPARKIIKTTADFTVVFGESVGFSRLVPVASGLRNLLGARSRD